MLKGGQLDGKKHLDARMHRGAGIIRALRCPGRCCADCATLSDRTTPAGISKESRNEPKPARAKTEGQAFRFLGPRGSLRLVHLHRPWLDFPGEFFVHNALADDSRDGQVEAFPIVHLATIVITEHLLIQVAEEMEGLDRNVSSLKRPLQETPEIFQSVGMDFATNVFYGMVNHFMLKLTQSLIRLKGVSEDRRSGDNVFAKFRLERLLFCARNDLHAHSAVALSAALKNAHNRSFVFSASASDDARTLRNVHVAGLAADEGFVRFDLAGQFVTKLLLMGQPDPMQHEPRGLLTDSESAVNLPRRDAILGVGNEPHCSEPLVQANGRILEDSSDFDGKLAALMMGSALPTKILRQKTHAGTTAGWAFHDAIRPALGGQIFQAICRVGEVYDGLLKGLYLLVFHALILAQKHGLVKSIIAVIWVGSLHWFLRPWVIPRLPQHSVLNDLSSTRGRDARANRASGWAS